MKNKINKILPELLLVIVLALLLTNFATYPFMKELSNVYFPREDFESNAWTLWYVFSKITSGSFSTLFSPPIHYPFPNILALFDFQPFQSLVLFGIPYYLTNNVAFSVNIKILLSFVLTFVSSYYSFKYFLKNKIAVLIAAIIFSFAPLVTIRFPGHMEYLSRIFIPPLLVLIHKIIEHPGIKYSLILAGIVALNVLNNLQLTLFSFILFIPYGVFLFLKKYKKSGKTEYLKQIVLSLIILFLSLFPILKIFITYREYSIKENYSRSIEEAADHSGNIFGFLEGNANGALYMTMHRVLNLFGIDYTLNHRLEMTLSSGAIAIVFFFILLVFLNKTKGHWAWIISSLYAMILSLGPYLNLNNENIKLPFYYLFQIFPTLSLTRTPGRIMLVGIIFIALIAGTTFEKIFKAIRNRSLKYLFVFVVVILLVVEVVNVYYMPKYSQLFPNFDMSKKIVAFLPTNESNAANTEYMIMSMQKDFILINGYTGTVFEDMRIQNLRLDSINSPDWENYVLALNIDLLVLDYSYKSSSASQIAEKYRDSLVWSDKRWAIYDFSKEKDSNCYIAGAKELDINTNKISKKEIWVTIENNTKCYGRFFGEDRYYLIQDESKYVTIPPVVLPGEIITRTIKE